MVNISHLTILKQGIDAWNQWRQEEPNLRPNLQGANLRGADLCAINFSHTYLSGADLRQAYLLDADLSAANLRNANLSRACLIGANLQDAYLSGANLSQAYLAQGDLSAAHLRESNLAGAHLQETILKGTYLRGADLNQADLSRAMGLTSAQVRFAKGWESADYSEELRQMLDSPTLSSPKMAELGSPVR